MDTRPTPVATIALRARARVSVIALALLAFSVSFLPSTRASTGTISGTAFYDLDRDGVVDAGEGVIAGHRIYLFNGGIYLAQSTTDATGRYSFTGLADGRYEAAYDASSWAPIKMEYTPTTTGSAVPSHTIDLSGSAVANFGWRRITWSTDPNAPIASLVAANGLRVQTYNDAVTPQEIVNTVMAGSVGVEAGTVLIRFALGSTSATATSVVNRGGVYEDFQATTSMSFESWLSNRFAIVGHEYGHAWSWYHAYMTQGDPTMAAYLTARGLSGDPRVGSTYAWGTPEMIAEDYRQLLGPVEGRAQAQANRDIPPAADVPGLANFLAHTFTTRPTVPQPTPSPTPQPTVTPTPTPTPTPIVLDVAGLTVAPVTVKQSATISFTLSAPSSVTIVVLGNSGAIVKTLLTAANKPSGAVKLTWDRTDSAGKRVRAGQYTVKVRAEDPAGDWDTAFATFPVG
jgi:hypothetical protein